MDMSSDDIAYDIWAHDSRYMTHVNGDVFSIDMRLNSGDRHSIRMSRSHVNRFASMYSLLAKIDRMFIESALVGGEE